MRRMVPFIGVVVLVLALAPPASATSGTMTITSNTILTEDHSGDIVIAADNVTLDCAGHLIAGPGSGDVIVIDGHSRVTVKNCRITAGDNGLVVRNSTGPNTLLYNSSFSNPGVGIFVLNADATSLIANVATGNGLGFLVDGGVQNLLRGNVARKNGDGFDLFGGSANTLLGNLSGGNNGYGFALGVASTGNTLAKNTATGNTYEGFALVFGSSGNQLLGNISQGNQAEGISLYFGADYNVVSANVITGNANSGVLVHQSSNNSITNNLSMLNNRSLLDGAAGISLVAGSSSNAILRNVACRNGNVDAHDDHSGSNNTWKANRFCTSDI